VALEQLRTWAAAHLDEYEDRHDDLAGDATSRMAAHLHFGCLSPLEVATRLRDRPGGAAFVRQLCWRDFYHQVLAGRPETARQDYRSRGDRWRDDPEDLAAWKAGRTGFPLVDAGMRQLVAEGFMHNRARMVVASFLTKDLYLDWRDGAAHFMSLLADGDVANNQLNWQWTAGTGTDSNPNRIFNPTVQSTRFDPTGDYIRRYVPELADVPAPQIHEPDEATRARVGYPPAIVDHREAIAAYRATLAR
jgi:deoxyribodipyrimidine photo-lyase